MAHRWTSPVACVTLILAATALLVTPAAAIARGRESRALLADTQTASVAKCTAEDGADCVADASAAAEAEGDFSANAAATAEGEASGNALVDVTADAEAVATEADASAVATTTGNAAGQSSGVDMGNGVPGEYDGVISQAEVIAETEAKSAGGAVEAKASGTALSFGGVSIAVSKATADAIAAVCNGGPAEAVAKAYASAIAQALVSVFTEAHASVVSVGASTGSASVQSTAQALGVATAKAYAEAVATATNNDSQAVAAAKAVGLASKIVAAASRATASVTAVGDASGAQLSRAGFSEFLDVMAEALAKTLAAVLGSEHACAASAESMSQTQTVAGAGVPQEPNVSPFSTSVSETTVSGEGAVEATGDADVDAEVLENIDQSSSMTDTETAGNAIANADAAASAENAGYLSPGCGGAVCSGAWLSSCCGKADTLCHMEGGCVMGFGNLRFYKENPEPCMC